MQKYTDTYEMILKHKRKERKEEKNLAFV